MRPTWAHPYINIEKAKSRCRNGDSKHEGRMRVCCAGPLAPARRSRPQCKESQGLRRCQEPTEANGDADTAAGSLLTRGCVRARSQGCATTSCSSPAPPARRRSVRWRLRAAKGPGREDAPPPLGLRSCLAHPLFTCRQEPRPSGSAQRAGRMGHRGQEVARPVQTQGRGSPLRGPLACPLGSVEVTLGAGFALSLSAPEMKRHQPRRPRPVRGPCSQALGGRPAHACVGPAARTTVTVTPGAGMWPRSCRCCPRSPSPWSRRRRQ